MTWLLVPEPDGLSEALQREKVPTLSEKEVKALAEDGVLLVRGLVQGKDALEMLRSRLDKHIQMPFRPDFLNHKSWLYNGAVRAVLRDGPLGGVLGQAMDEHRIYRPFDDAGKEDDRKDGFISLNEAPIWGFPASRWPWPESWHTDSRDRSQRQVTIWMVLVDVPLPLQFIRGSHAARDEIENRCGVVVPGDKYGHKDHNQSCIERVVPALVEKALNMTGPALHGADLKAGDAWIFNGDVLHRGWRRTCPRVALSLRVKWRAGPPDGRCPVEPLLFPAGPMMKHGYDCSPWALLPGLPRTTPWLPAGEFADKVLRLLERA